MLAATQTPPFFQGTNLRGAILFVYGSGARVPFVSWYAGWTLCCSGLGSNPCRAAKTLHEAGQKSGNLAD